jgi:hypothetical protein
MPEEKGEVYPYRLAAVYTGDSANYHIFQIPDDLSVVASIYIRKDTEGGIPHELSINLTLPTRNKEAWLKGITTLKDNARDGSKAKTKLIRTISNHK